MDAIWEQWNVFKDHNIIKFDFDSTINICIMTYLKYGSSDDLDGAILFKSRMEIHSLEKLL